MFQPAWPFKRLSGLISPSVLAYYEPDLSLHVPSQLNHILMSLELDHNQITNINLRLIQNYSPSKETHKLQTTNSFYTYTIILNLQLIYTQEKKNFKTTTLLYKIFSK